MQRQIPSVISDSIVIASVIVLLLYVVFGPLT